MPSLRIAAAQSSSIAGDVAANVLIHTRFIAAAHQAQVDLLVFPELSLSGYELPLLRDCLLQPEDSRLAPIRTLVRETRMTVVVGAPMDWGTGAKPAIAVITFFPDGNTSIYCKQYLHPGEEQYVAGGDAGSLRHGVLDQSFALAIFSSSHPIGQACGAVSYTRQTPHNFFQPQEALLAP